MPGFCKQSKSKTRGISCPVEGLLAPKILCFKEIICFIYIYLCITYLHISLYMCARALTVRTTIKITHTHTQIYIYAHTLLNFANSYNRDPETAPDFDTDRTMH